MLDIFPALFIASGFCIIYCSLLIVATNMRLILYPNFILDKNSGKIMSQSGDMNSSWNVFMSRNEPQYFLQRCTISVQAPMQDFNHCFILLWVIFSSEILFYVGDEACTMKSFLCKFWMTLLWWNGGSTKLKAYFKVLHKVLHFGMGPSCPIYLEISLEMSNEHRPTQTIIWFSLNTN